MAQAELAPSPGAGPLGLNTDAPALEDHAFSRLWQAFMTARVGMAATLLAVQSSIYLVSNGTAARWAAGLCIVYLIATLAVRLLVQPRAQGAIRRQQWRYTISVDVLMYGALELMQVGNINYTPLFALPLLLAAVLGSLRLAIGTAASVTLLLLTNAIWVDWTSRSFVAAQFFQAGITGAAYFALALLVHQLASRLLREERRSRENAAAASLQRQVADMVTESLDDGVLVVNSSGHVRVANPAALRLLGPGFAAPNPPFPLGKEQGWSELHQMAQHSFEHQAGQEGECDVRHSDEPIRRLQVRTRMTTSRDEFAENLCVMFLQDLRELEAKIRTEKLAAMGRMSTAVAHEIRNPLAAIAQANQLLGEDLHDPSQQRLSLMVGQNATRLAKIVEEILDIARVKQGTQQDSSTTLQLDTLAQAVGEEWARQNDCGQQLTMDLKASEIQVLFDPDHLRRVMVNLLDNALRHAQPRNTAVFLQTSTVKFRRPSLIVWNEGPPLERTMLQHLFEPFFSSESRSSGLGLYICRELCDRHQAFISYRRASRPLPDPSETMGNEFRVSFRVTGERRQNP